MSSRQDIIESLRNFSSIPIVSEIIQGLSVHPNRYNHFKRSKHSNPKHCKQAKLSKCLLQKIKRKLHQLLLDKQYNTNTSLVKAAHRVLLILVQLNPFNENDPITLEKIDKARQVFISTGNKFDLYELVYFHNVRDYRGKWGETDKSKYLVNPLTNDKLSMLDAMHVLEEAKAKGLKIENLKLEQTTSFLNPCHWFGFFNSPLLNQALSGNSIRGFVEFMWDCHETDEDEAVYHL